MRYGTYVSFRFLSHLVVLINSECLFDTSPPLSSLELWSDWVWLAASQSGGSNLAGAILEDITAPLHMSQTVNVTTISIGGAAAQPGGGAVIQPHLLAPPLDAQDNDDGQQPVQDQDQNQNHWNTIVLDLNIDTGITFIRNLDCTKINPWELVVLLDNSPVKHSPSFLPWWPMHSPPVLFRPVEVNHFDKELSWKIPVE